MSLFYFLILCTIPVLATKVHKWLFPDVVYHPSGNENGTQLAFSWVVYQSKLMIMVHKLRFPEIMYHLGANKNGTQPAISRDCVPTCTIHIILSGCEYVKTEL